MRVIAGIARGHPLKGPSGTGTRPTTDYVRGAIFNLLENLSCDWSRVLDLYAGSGALGIEALSRGAAWVDFIEQDASACRVIHGNLTATRFSDQAAVHCTTVRRAMEMLTDCYDIIFVDPPYADAEAYALLPGIAESRIVHSGTVFVVEHSSRMRPNDPGGGFRLIRERRYGDTTVSLYGTEEGATVDDRGLPGNL